MILNRQRRVSVSLRSLERFWDRARLVLRLPEDAVTICLVSETAIAGWNRTYRGRSGPTDVLSFPTQEVSGGARRSGHNGTTAHAAPLLSPGLIASHATIGLTHYLGDIAISPAVARMNARRTGRTLDEELCILILHGTLHLLGYDHEVDHGEMERRERRLRRRLGLGRR